MWLADLGIFARTRTCSVLAMWLSRGYTKLRWKPFHSIFVEHCGFVKAAHHKTDFCEYCHLLTTTQAPPASSSRSVWHPPAILGQNSCCVQVRERFGACENLAAIHGQPHGRKHKRRGPRTKLKPARRQDLLELEAKVETRRRWEIKVADAYFWHKTSADRQTSTVYQERTTLQPDHALIWTDFKQTLRSPYDSPDFNKVLRACTSRTDLHCFCPFRRGCRWQDFTEERDFPSNG